MVSAVGLGELTGNTLYGAVGHRVSRRALTVRPPLPLILVAFVLIGLVRGPLTPLAVTIRHERIPPVMRGRVFATYSAIGRVADPAGIVFGGVAIAAFGFGPNVIFLAVAAQVTVLSMLVLLARRRIDQQV